MTSYKYSGFKIMVLNDNKCRLPRNFFVIDRATYGDNVLLPPPPKHFKYVKEERSVFFFISLLKINLLQRLYYAYQRCL